MKTDKLKTEGRPDEAFSLAIDLMKAFRKSELFNSDRTDPHFAFDAMVGIATFTALVLNVFKEASSQKVDLCNFYKDTLLSDLCESNITLEMLHDFSEFLKNPSSN
jgi:hypothetical protein